MTTKPSDHQDSFKNILDFTSLQIKLASPEIIKMWSHGEVTKPETINYRTLRPEKDGLFDERIFGPVKDWECYCGKYKRIRYKGIICDKCGVEVTQSRVRRERMGHITLACPVAHVWYFKGAPSKLSLLLDVAPKALESVMYFAQFIVTSVDVKEQAMILDRLQKQSQEARAKIKSDTADKIAALQTESEKDQKALQTSGLNEDARGLAESQLQLKLKQQAQSLRDAEAAEDQATLALYQRLSDIVKNLKLASILTEEEYLKLGDHKAADFLEVGMGAEAVLAVIAQINLDELASGLRREVTSTTGQRHIKATKRLRVVDGLRRAGVAPAWTILKVLPVIPPDLRPMVQLAGGRFATSDLNDLYRRVINRNHRLKHLIDLGAPEIILRNEKRMLQEAVDSLIDSAQHTRIVSRRLAATRSRSLSDMLRGKQGRFRQNLLGKRVDYSGRSVIVVGPELKLSQCGLPKDMALEMFKPFVLRQMIVQDLAPNVKSAKNILEARPPEVFDILEEITKNHPVILNRAPTLHKLSIQAFYPILIEGSAIRIHPCVCAGFNADFDGDQMAVHVPIGAAAIAEAKALMMPEQNLRKPADGTPVSIPSTKEMALGNYYLTSIDSVLPVYPSPLAWEEAVRAYHMGYLKLRQPAQIQINAASVIETTVGRLFFNSILPAGLRFVNEPVRRSTVVSLFVKAFQLYSTEIVVQLIDSIKNLGFWAGTLSGLSVSITDCVVSPDRDQVIAAANEAVSEIEQNFTSGLITAEEKKRLSQEVWLETTDKLADITWQLIDKANPIHLMVDAQVGRVSREQVKQLSAMRGLVVDPLGNIVDLPIKSNYRQGFSTFEYISAARGERKGLSDTAIRTADAGYLTRRLVDVAHDAIIRLEDCGTSSSLTISRHDRRPKFFLVRLFGRILAADVANIPAGTLLDASHLAIIEAKNIDQVAIRSTLTCNAPYGLCAKCYGLNLASMAMAQIGDPVGVVAAQSIGEPGTQMTLHGKRGSTSAGGIDVTQGLPRVEELFEARTPKLVSPLAEISGKVELVETDSGYKIRIRNTSVKPIEEREYLIPLTAELKVGDGDLVTTGTQLAAGSIDIKEALEVRGLRGAQEYLIEEIQLVYESQGIPIHDKHFEVIVRKMSDRVRVLTSGDTTLLPGDIVDRFTFETENARVLAAGGEPATAQVVILGITRSALKTGSWLSAASFIETTSQLADAAIEGRIDPLLGLKENVIIGRLIPVSPERAGYANN
ncbi:MAG: DNA-directed RNA polymerase subunit beta' [Candidatus Amesbacteria bacterium GW2011_GWB1_47_26]|uniref:DNA-directed RNA polymerase subunit beta' n=1 Tax=Candidatus Amesbacteria bacterium GW2011_GWC2_45_19 TaxID=1618366 RepID=A0A0G1M4K8_9BACT|nr:MAG: DNA-directed RNA polymerase subunit beta' [Candidatus Amesbacteria bacterium GW2011_GWC2_45_19]KKU38504.1 MAG: DNA-directed RNA polymerase subunit beta' [Candidatus Amesbacteria bacterium GW2011_GWA1_46_35]KKU69207.1 MAG: DNA-directed RNA polymerase subunit beta' [Microgenomates group bacterium GW2011_GWC1_47_20]KKU74672.1 MAG: DNA-directed RNA polymerase subunit beta' [Candidatus Amesbacteria bacterium GW2011_GWB1_47_26]KKU80140.1 MAG: DNA-directed RNA polymerase subunit beta' [Candida